MLQFRVNDLSCGHCVKTITRAVAAIDPKARVEADIAAKLVRIASTRAVAALTRALEDAGYPAAVA